MTSQSKSPATRRQYGQLFDKPMKANTIKIREEDWELMMSLGNGNKSDGARILCDFWRKKNKKRS